MNDNVIILEDEDGVEVEFETLDVFEFEGQMFFALAECLPDGDVSDEILMMRVEGDIESEEAELVMAEDEEQARRAFDEFIRRDELNEE